MMDCETIAKELAEEIRTNGALRRRIGMAEGTGSEVVLEPDATGVVIQTIDGEQFVLAVGEVTED